ncbi:MAG: DUF3592 domain-containing protein [Helicobacteraceae bacterium]|jgi:hypothetical protein|nr:DUF3592 domain-containing protein [Helicobacteraceae bacterium]
MNKTAQTHDSAITPPASKRFFATMGVLFLGTACLFLIMLIRMFIDVAALQLNAEQVTATITKIEKKLVGRETASSGSSAAYKHTVLVRYAYNGADYEEPLDFYSSTMDVGDKVDIYVYRDNPKIISIVGKLWFLTFFIALSIVFALVGLKLVKRASKAKVSADTPKPPARF